MRSRGERGGGLWAGMSQFFANSNKKKELMKNFPKKKQTFMEMISKDFPFPFYVLKYGKIPTQKKNNLNKNKEFMFHLLCFCSMFISMFMYFSLSCRLFHPLNRTYVLNETA